ncbi:MAG: hypothetical protein FJY75_00315 [Candidatus Eisenbacteria bacterium]|uniref:FlgD Ig-like domain-containing protein n=1 Tax=Eiseniibacteriota bacterium TaxID=2212470 RepID=A0A937X6Y6_UNCEI|nr:hypothetical protein [Candidatus Eisenbacteria bacterium]
MLGFRNAARAIRRFAPPAALALIGLAGGPLPCGAAADLVILDAAPAADGAPVCRGYRIVQPGSRVGNGDLLEFFSFWDQADTVRADLTLLDDQAPAALLGTYVGDSSVVVGDDLHVWSAYWFAYRLAEANARPDAARIAVPITGSGPAGSTTNEALSLCLSNRPPRHLATAIIGDAARYTLHEGRRLYTVRNGDSLRIETTWSFHSRPFFTTADFSAVDDSFSAARVYYELVDAPAETLQTHALYYELDEAARGPGLAALPLRIHGRDGGCGRDSVTLSLLLDNEPPALPPRLDPLPETATDPALRVSGTGPAGARDILVVLNQTDRFVLPLTQAGDSLVFSGTVTLRPGPNQLVAHARDLVGNRGPGTTARAVQLVPAPVFKHWRILQPDTLSLGAAGAVAVANGQTILVRSEWDSRAPYQVTADFSGLDGAFDPAAVRVTQVEDRVVAVGGTTEVWAGYQIEYTISAANSLPDAAGRIVPVTAFDPSTGYSATTSSLALCLSNRPPRHVATRFLGGPERFVERDGETLFTLRNGGSVYLLTEWATPRPLRTVEADFSAVDEDFIAALARVHHVDSLSTDSTRVYRIFYEFSLDACCAPGQAPYPLPVGITVQDPGCGRAQTIAWVEMDNEGPAGSPLLDAAPPEATAASSVTLSGRAPEGSWTLLAVVDHATADSLTTIEDPLLEADGAFSVSLPLLAGENRITLYGADPVGNRSAPTPTYRLQRIVGARRVTVPKPFHAGDAFSVESAAGLSAAELELYNLEGDLIRRWAFDGGPRLFFSAPWDGRNGRGEPVRQGAYLLRIETRDAAGRGDREVRAVVFQR